MPGTDLAVVDQRTSFDLLPVAQQMAEAIARTEFVPKALRNRPDAVMACVLAGHEIGVPPMQALSKIHIIEGRPAQASELMRALVLRAGHDLWIEESSITKATICGQRLGSDHTTRITWTMDDAKRANLSGKDNWRRYPRAMLLARATAELCRMVFPDVLGGLSYAVEEVQDGFVWDDVGGGDVIDVEPDTPAVPAPATHTRKAKATTAKKAAPRKAAASRPPRSTPPPAPGFDQPPAGQGPAGPPPAPVTDQTPAWAQTIAMRCRDIGVDRARLITAVTGGRKTSGRDLDEAEAHAVLEAARQIKAGEKHLTEGPGGEPMLADGFEPFPDEPDDDDVVDAEIVDDEDDQAADDPMGPLAEVDWDLEQWQAFVKDQRCKVVETLRRAREIAGEMGLTLPSGMADLRGNRELAPAVRGWLEEQGAERGVAS